MMKENNEEDFSVETAEKDKKETENTTVATEEKKNKKAKRELTPAEMQRRKKMLVYPLFFLAFVGCMYLIFAPDSKTEDAESNGFNTELPSPTDDTLISDKREAYIQEAMENRRKEKMRSLDEFTVSLDEPIQPETGSAHNRNEEKPDTKRASLEASTAAYEDINRQLGHWYEEPATEKDEQAELELQWRIQMLEQKLEEQEAAKSAEQQQLELIEKSYAIASKYMPRNATNEETPSVDHPKSQPSGRKTIVEPVTAIQQNVVSLLSAPMEDSVFMEEYSKPRNWTFSGIGPDETIDTKNSIQACIHKTVTIASGQEVQVRLLEAMRAGRYIIPRNTILSGTARITGERLTITFNAVQYEGRVIPVEITVYDMDGNRGISVPGSEELNAIKEVAANMGSSMSSSITITDDASSQLLSDLGRSAIQGASQYLSKKMRAVKVTLKADYRVLLLSTGDNLQ